MCNSRVNQFCYCVFFFFKQKTAYEMRISDWSSDVCSSDLPVPPLDCRIDRRNIASPGVAVEASMNLAAYSEDGYFAPKRIAAALRTTSDEVARTVGLGRDAVQRRDRNRSDRTQRRLREMLEILKIGRAHD